jgi:predicted  nucleic acid-binding Zn-ribbon protein
VAQPISDEAVDQILDHYMLREVPRDKELAAAVERSPKLRERYAHLKSAFEALEQQE